MAPQLPIGHHQTVNALMHQLPPPSWHGKRDTVGQTIGERERGENISSDCQRTHDRHFSFFFRRKRRRRRNNDRISRSWRDGPSNRELLNRRRRRCAQKSRCKKKKCLIDWSWCALCSAREAKRIQRDSWRGPNSGSNHHPPPSVLLLLHFIITVYTFFFSFFFFFSQRKDSVCRSILPFCFYVLPSRAGSSRLEIYTSTKAGIRFNTFTELYSPTHCLFVF